MTMPVEKSNLYPVNGEGGAVVKEFQDGHISLFRSIRKHWIWQDANKLKWWLDILLEVNHKDKKVLIGNELIMCKRGECIVSILTWSKRWRTTRSSVRRFFALLQSDSMIVLKSNTKTTHITVCNYDSYQSWRPTVKPTNGQQTNNEVTTTNNGNNDNNERRGKFLPPTEPEVKAYFTENGYSEQAAVKAFKYYDVANWKDSKGNKVRNWKQKMQSVWFKDEHKIQASQKRMVD